MDSSFRTKETLFIETANRKIFSLIPAGRRIPAEWEQTFTTYEEGQTSIDFHLLRGVTNDYHDCVLVGKWRLAGIPPTNKGKQLIRVKIRIGVDGTVWMIGSIKNIELVVTMLTETVPKVPLTIRVPDSQKEKMVQTACWSCKSRNVIETKNWKNEPFALCLDCGNEFALPVTLQTSVTAPWEDLPPELLRTMGVQIPHIPGGLTPQELHELKEKGFDIDFEEEKDLTTKTKNFAEQISSTFFGKQSEVDELNYEEIVRRAGDPIPEDKRRKCPNCDAVISQETIRCEWCGKNI